MQIYIHKYVHFNKSYLGSFCNLHLRRGSCGFHPRLEFVKQIYSSFIMFVNALILPFYAMHSLQNIFKLKVE